MREKNLYKADCGGKKPRWLRNSDRQPLRKGQSVVPHAPPPKLHSNDLVTPKLGAAK